MLEMGLVVAIGLIVTFFKVPVRTKLWMTSHPVAMDLIVFIGLTTIHWGSYSGVMVATVGALFTSITLSAARWVIGHIKTEPRGRVYYRGVIDYSDQL